MLKTMRETKMNEKRTLKKINEKEYELRIDNEENKYYQRKIYEKDQLKENYHYLKTQLQNLEFNIKGHKNQLKQLDVKFSKDELKIKDVVEKVLKNTQADKLKMELDKFEDDMQLLKKQCSEIEVAVPEVLRNK